jgi:hypothetical protein
MAAPIVMTTVTTTVTFEVQLARTVWRGILRNRGNRDSRCTVCALTEHFDHELRDDQRDLAARRFRFG